MLPKSGNNLKAGLPNDMEQIAIKIVADLPRERIFALFGKMGSGKTTLIKAFCNVLGVENVVSSPTFSLVNEYVTKQGEIVFHFDFYRINDINEVYDIGYEEYMYSGNYCFLEWPEMITELLPKSYVYISIEENNLNERLIHYSIKTT